MLKFNSSTLLAILGLAGLAAAHGHVSNIIINGVSYEGYGSTSFPYQHSPPIVAGWAIDQLDNGFVLPDAYGNPDIICHREATPSPAYIEIAAGDVITLQWTKKWPENHHGPIVDYLANCHGPCSEVKKERLEFFKIDGLGLLEQGRPGRYADSVMKDNNYRWNVRIPENIEPGNYVLRHEIIALHNAIEENGAQHYPQCFNLKIVGGGSDSPIGYHGTELYDPEDPGLHVNIYAATVDYQVPGPTIVEGGMSSCKQSPSRATATASATIYKN